MNKWLHNAILVKVAITAGLVLIYVLPENMRELALLPINLVWLWKG